MKRDTVLDLLWIKKFLATFSSCGQMMDVNITEQSSREKVQVLVVIGRIFYATNV